MRDTSLRAFIEITIISVAFIIAFVIAFYTLPKHGTIKYDCSIAEISPDFPIEVREQCRKLRAESFNKDLLKPK